LYSKNPVPLKIRAVENGLVILENGEEIGRAQIIQPPDWYDQTVEGYPITSVLTQHNDQLTGSVYEWCSLFNTGEACRFCVIDRSQSRPELKNIKRKAELIMKALEVVPREAYRGVNLNGGMTFSEGRGLELLVPVVEDIRKKLGDVPIAVEITPPQDLEWIEKFAEAGGESLMMNLETWDDSIRRDLLPGKDKYCPKESYFKAFEKAVEVLGQGKVSTCFVVGTEPVESLKEGLKAVIDYGVVPSPLAGRNFEQFTDYPFKAFADWKDLIEIFRFSRAEMAKKGLTSTDEAGCVACGMCDIIGDI
jgi:biotin synthase-related radical SAM superfamily protein